MSQVENIEQFVGQLKVVELREELKKRHLSYAGNKKDLAQRLQEAMVKEKMEQQAEDSVEENAPDESPEEDVEKDGVDVVQVDEQENGEEAATTEEEGKETEAMPAEEQPPPTDAAEEKSEPQQEEAAPEAAELTSTSVEEPQAAEEPEAAGEEGQEETTEEEGEKEAATTGEGEGMETSEGGEAVQNQESDKTEGEQMESGTTTQEQEESKTEDTADKKEDEDTKEGGGVKRQREDEDSEDERDRRSDKVDPSSAPDPEEPEKFDESAIKNDFEEQFKPPEDDVTITLDRYNSDLHFKIGPDGLGGCNLSEHGFAYLWASARATWGVKGGKYYYEVRVEENLEVDLPDTEEHPHAIRVGWSLDEAELSLGEVPNSYGYGGTGKTSSANKFNTYGEPYGPGDVIGCFLDLESTPGTISFSKNGQHFDTAFTLEEGEMQGKALFPHVATKNVRMSLNFVSPAWSEVEGVEGYLPLQEATEEHKIRATKGPESPSECEVLMMIGLPASGKTTWAEKHCRDHPEKRFTILGTNLIMDKMKVTGLGRKQNYHGRWEALIKQSTEVLNAMFLLAGKNLRNYIIDQTNVYDGAQRRKMSYFEGFVKKAVVVVPPHHILRQRTAKRNSEMGQPVPDDAINAMKANFHVPRKGSLFEDVLYAEIYGVAADKIVRQYREDALGLPSYPTTKRGRYDRSPSGGGGGRYGPPRSGGGGGGRGGGGGYSPYPYSRQPYGYGYGRSPPYSPYGHSPYGHAPPPPPPHMYGGHGGPPPRGGHGGGYRHPPYPPRPYGGGGRGGYGPPPHRGGGGYYGGGGGYHGRY